MAAVIFDIDRGRGGGVFDIIIHIDVVLIVIILIDNVRAHRHGAFFNGVGTHHHSERTIIRQISTQISLFQPSILSQRCLCIDFCILGIKMIY